MANTDSLLLQQLKNREDEGSWREFVAIYEPLIRHLVRRSGIPPGDVADVVQEVLVQLLLAIPRFNYRKERGRFRHWLRRVTLNKVQDQRRRMPRPAQSLDSLADLAENGLSADLWSREMQLRLVRYALKTVREKARPDTWRCFAGHVLEGRNAAAVAFEMGITENAVYVNCSRVLRKIRQFCAKHGEELEHVQFALPQ